MFLEDVFPPQKLVWLSANVCEVDAGCRRRLAAHLEKAAATHGAENPQYVKEALTCLAHLRGPPSPGENPQPVAITRFDLLSKVQKDCFDESYRRDIEHTIRGGYTNDINIHRKYMHILRTRHLATLERHTVSKADCGASPETSKMMLTLLKAFVKETTFKVHGDASLHAEIVTCMLPNFISSMQGHLQTPYQLVASVYPQQVNDMVRPILATRFEDRVNLIDFNNRLRVRDFILAASVLMELLGNKKAVLLTNDTICHASPELTLMYVIRKDSSDYEVGLREGGKLRVYDQTCAVSDVVIDFVRRAHIATPGLVENVYSLLFRPEENNPLNKYVAPQQ